MSHLKVFTPIVYAGATLGKGFNRMLATFFAGALGIGSHHLATLCGETGEPILISTFVFIIGTQQILLHVYIVYLVKIH